MTSALFDKPHQLDQLFCYSWSCCETANTVYVTVHLDYLYLFSYRQCDSFTNFISMTLVQGELQFMSLIRIINSEKLFIILHAPLGQTWCTFLNYAVMIFRHYLGLVFITFFVFKLKYTAFEVTLATLFIYQDCVVPLGPLTNNLNHCVTLRRPIKKIKHQLVLILSTPGYKGYSDCLGYW